jgi:hypothetical protein
MGQRSGFSGAQSVRLWVAGKEDAQRGKVRALGSPRKRAPVDGQMGGNDDLQVLRFRKMTTYGPEISAVSPFADRVFAEGFECGSIYRWSYFPVLCKNSPCRWRIFGARLAELCLQVKRARRLCLQVEIGSREQRTENRPGAPKNNRRSFAPLTPGSLWRTWGPKRAPLRMTGL